MSRSLLQFFESQNYFEFVGPEHLLESLQCNYSDFDIQDLAQKLFHNLDRPEKKARAAYDFIRNQILYAFSPWEERATQTLRQNRGNCFHKSNVMVALLRSQEIPCVFSAFSIHKRSFEWFLEKDFYENLNEESLHVYVEVFLNETWRRYVDTSIDALLRQKVLAQGIDPFDCVNFEKPIRRFFTPEEIVSWMRKQSPALALSELNTSLLEQMNLKFHKFRI